MRPIAGQPVAMGKMWVCSVRIAWFAEDPFHCCAVQTQVAPPAVDVLNDVLAIHGDDQFEEVCCLRQSQPSSQRDDVPHVPLTSSCDDLHGQKVLVGSGAHLQPGRSWRLQWLG
jgi:hypothetical protein